MVTYNKEVYFKFSIILLTIIFFCSNLIACNEKNEDIETINTDESIILDNTIEESYFDSCKNDLGKYKEVNNIVILINFKDSNDYTKDDIVNIKNSFNGEKESLRDYYNMASFGKFKVNSIFPQNEIIYNAPEESSYYNDDISKGRELLNNAFNECKDKIEENIDVNNDNIIDSVYFVVDKESSRNEFLWPHVASFSKDNKTSIKNSKLINYSLVTLDFINKYGYKVLAHEFGHTLGYKDDYNPSDSSTLDMGNYSIMSNMSGDLSVFEKQKYTSWIDEDMISDISEDKEYQLFSTSNYKKGKISYRINTNKEEYFILEYRNSTQNIYEKDIPCSGLLVSRIKYGDKENYNQNIILGQAVDEEDYKIKLCYENGDYSGYTVKLKTIDEEKLSFDLMKEDVNNSIKINHFNTSTNKPYKSSKIFIYAQASGDKNKLKYKFTAEVEKEEKVIKDYDEVSNTFWTPGMAGYYILRVYVTDGNTTKKAERLICVSDDLIINSFSVNKSDNGYNILCSSQGGVGRRLYKFTVCKDDHETVINDFNRVNSTKWVPEENGEYKVYVYLTDGIKVLRKSCDVNVDSIP